MTRCIECRQTCCCRCTWLVLFGTGFFRSKKTLHCRVPNNNHGTRHASSTQMCTSHQQHPLSGSVGLPVYYVFFCAGRLPSQTHLQNVFDVIRAFLSFLQNAMHDRNARTRTNVEHTRHGTRRTRLEWHSHDVSLDVRQWS